MAANVDFADPLLLKTALLVVLCPTIWNVIARHEYRKHTLRNLTGSVQGATYVFFVWIFFFSLYRDYVFHQMVESQPTVAALQSDLVRLVGAVSLGVGQVFVLTSLWKLGLAGTYLGDYAGWFVFDAPVVSFPFNVLEHPMYVGSALSFLGSSLWNASAAGVLMTALIYVVYHIAATYFEGPFTSMIYAKKAKQQK